jgi:hypothetical protein
VIIDPTQYDTLNTRKKKEYKKKLAKNFICDMSDISLVDENISYVYLELCAT